MSSQTACTPCAICQSSTYSSLFQKLDELTQSVNHQNLSSIVEEIERLGKDNLLTCHSTVFSFKFYRPELRDQYWKTLKVKARNPESVVDTILKSEVIKEHEFGITRQVFLKGDLTQTPRKEDVFVDESQKSVLFVVKPPEGSSFATNRIVEIGNEVHFQGVYFYLRHRDPKKEDLLGTHQRIFENIKNRVIDGSVDKLYATYYKKPQEFNPDPSSHEKISSKKMMMLIPFAIAAIAIVCRIFKNAK